MPPSPAELSASADLAPDSGRGEARSLFGEILDWMFAPLLLLWPMSVSLTYLVAQSIASTPYDRALIERGENLAAHVRFVQGRAHFDLSPGLIEIYGTGVGEPGTYLVADADGTLLAGDHDLPRGAEPSPARGAYDTNFSLRDDTLRGHPVRVAYAWVHEPNAQGPQHAAALVEVAELPTERTQLANEIVKGVILPQFVVLPLALVLVWFGLSRGLAPLARLQRTIRARPPEDLSPISTEAAPEELTPLLASFNDLLSRMAHNLDVQKRFIADAAHQMKTPLAGLKTQAELAQRGGNATDLQRSLRQIAASTDRATRLVNQLLALAHAEHGAGDRDAMVAVDLDALARAVVRDWVNQAISMGIDLGFEGPQDRGTPADCQVLGAPTLLREMLNNLIDNALRYGTNAAVSRAEPGAAPADPDRVTVRVHREGASVVLEVEDDGPGIAPEERSRVFDRFYRVLGSGQDGSGLGLAIVREIATQHRAQVLLTQGERGRRTPTGRPGTLFRITFSLWSARSQ